MTWIPLGAPLIAGILIEIASRMLGTMAVSTGLVAGASRALATLKRAPSEQVEWMTAAGFGAGLVLGALIFVLDLVFG